MEGKEKRCRGREKSLRHEPVNLLGACRSRAWGVDQDAFAMNQFAHPYQGSMYHGFARSAGLNYRESLLYANVGSFLWETGGETTHPSINDQFASGIAGSFFGEALFRMANLVLEGDGGKPGLWRELGATMLSPPTGIKKTILTTTSKPPTRAKTPKMIINGARTSPK